MSPRPAIAFALSLAAMPACAESGQEWLARMTAALNNASYVGEFISESAGRTERLVAEQAREETRRTDPLRRQSDSRGGGYGRHVTGPRLLS